VSADLEKMIADFAAAAVSMAREMQVTLDYTEASIAPLESLLDALYRDIHHPPVRDLDSAQPPAPTAAQMDDLCRLWGSYLGEVVRRRWGGEWALEQYPGGGFATLVLNIGGNKLFPSLKIYRRLSEGEADSINTFYDQVRAKLSVAPGNAVQ
jgi:hypothetical protein